MSTKAPPKKISVADQDKNNPLRGLFDVTKKKEVKVLWEKLEITEVKEANEDGEYKQQSWSIRNGDGAELGTVFFCTELFKFYHLGLKQQGLDGKDKADRMGLAKDMQGCVKKMLRNLWGDQYRLATGQESAADLAAKEDAE